MSPYKLLDTNVFKTELQYFSALGAWKILSTTLKSSKTFLTSFSLHQTTLVSNKHITVSRTSSPYLQWRTTWSSVPRVFQTFSTKTFQTVISNFCHNPRKNIRNVKLSATELYRGENFSLGFALCVVTMECALLIGCACVQSATVQCDRHLCFQAEQVRHSTVCNR